MSLKALNTRPWTTWTTFHPENTAHVGEPHCIPRCITYEHHATYNSDSGNDSRNAHIYQFLERKVQSHREQQKMTPMSAHI